MDVKRVVDASSSLAELVKNFYDELKKENPKYSVRLFARRLEISHSYLQKIINGEKYPSHKTVMKLFNEFNLDYSYFKLFKHLDAKKNMKGLSLIAKDASASINSSLHLILISLINEKQFPTTITWFESVLNWSRDEIERNLKYLVDTDLIIENEGIFSSKLNQHLKIPSHPDGSLIKSIRSDFDAADNDSTHFIFLPANNGDEQFIRRFISSSFVDLAKTVSEGDSNEEVNQLFEIVCRIKPVLKNKPIF